MRFILNGVLIDEEIRPISERVLEIKGTAHQRLLGYTRATDGEISGLGKVRFSSDKVVVEKVRIYKQVCTGSNTTLDEEALSQFLLNMARSNSSNQDWKLWWHSHADFAPFWSGTDENTIRTLSAESGLVSVCINKMGEMIARYDNRRKHEDMRVVVLPLRNVDVSRRCRSEVKRKVNEEVIDEKRILQGFPYYTRLSD